MKYPKEELFDRAGQPKMPTKAQLIQRWATPAVVMGDFNDNPWDISVRLVGDASYDRKAALRTPRFPNSRAGQKV